MAKHTITHTSEIKITVGLDGEKVPVHIDWSASDMHPEGTTEECKAMVIALFDEAHKDTLRIDLWTKDMQVVEMDRFMYRILQSLSETYLRATNNRNLAEQMAQFAHYFGKETEIIE
jgi:gliding motility-associated protein GldC